MLARWRRGTLTRRALVLIAIAEFAAMALALGAYRYSRPVPALATSTTFAPSVTAPGVARLPLPVEGQAALAIDGVGLIATAGDSDQAAPIASTTKIMTALVVLDGHPITVGEQGPTIEITSDHAVAFLDAILGDESAVEVREGEDLTLREALDGLLVASANNYARILADWDAGSQVAFVAKMNARAQQMGLRNTHFVDPSGLDPRNVSTAEDLLALAQAAMAHETFAAIVGQREVTLPVVGQVPSTNQLLERDGVLGVKTGETDEAGACLVFASEVDTVAGKLVAYGVVLGQAERQDVFDVSGALVEETAKQVAVIDVAAKGTVVGLVSSSWGERSAVVTADAVRLPAWPGQRLAITAELRNTGASISAGDSAGELIVWRNGIAIARVALVYESGIGSPGAGWRLLRN